MVMSNDRYPDGAETMTDMKAVRYERETPDGLGALAGGRKTIFQDNIDRTKHISRH